MGIIKDLVVGSQQRKAAKKASREIRKGRDRAAGGLEAFAAGGEGANTAILGALGQGEPGAQDEAFQNFLNSTGFQSQLRAGSQAITGNAASRGLLNSGATLKRQTQFGQDLAQGGFSNFLSQLGGAANRGLSARQSQGNIITGATNLAANTTLEGRTAFNTSIGRAFDTAGRVATAGITGGASEAGRAILGG